MRQETSNEVSVLDSVKGYVKPLKVVLPFAAVGALVLALGQQIKGTQECQERTSAPSEVLACMNGAETGTVSEDEVRQIDHLIMNFSSQLKELGIEL